MASTADKTLFVIAGPTAIGKTAAAIQLAKHYDTDIISADSRQFYREISIGTAKPNEVELTAAKHHFINSHSVIDNFNVGDFEREALGIIDTIFKSNNIAIMAGGSALFIKAVCEGFDKLPVASPGIRERLNKLYAEHGLKALQEKLLHADPEYYHQVDINNPQRLIRALEVFESTGKPITFYQTGNTTKRPFRIIKIGLNMPRGQLYERINLRVDVMVQQGLVDEVRSLLPYRNFNALNTVGYSEIFDYLDNKTDLKTAVELIKQHTRQFAKRQLTWFNKDKDIVWVNPLEQDVVRVSENLLNLL